MNWEQVRDRMPLWALGKFYAWRYKLRQWLPERVRSKRVWYEVNVAIDGWHLFATDSQIRHYTPVRVASMICEFRRAWPKAKVTATAFGGRIDPLIQAALDGTIDERRLDKAVGKFRSGVQKERSNDYVGGASSEEAEAS